MFKYALITLFFHTYLSPKEIGAVENVKLTDERPVMVYIPGGTFWMGGSDEDGIIGISLSIDTFPKHKVKVKSFYIDKYEVIIEEYREFLKQTNSKEPSYWEEIAKNVVLHDDDPAFAVNWHDADDFCKWAGKRLPTEEEWEYAARGKEGYLWPWGNDFVYENLNVMSEDVEKPDWVLPVGSIPGNVSPFGVYDMAGNVAEWTSSTYQHYPGSNIKRKAFGITKVMRGGSYYSLQWMATTIHRRAINAYVGQPDFGFRCAKS